MKKQLLAGVALLAAIPVSAMAADLGRPAPAPVYKAPPPITMFSWTGIYVGGNLGGAWSQGNVTDALTGANFSGTSNGVFVGGGQVGANYQFSNLVIGIE